MSTDQNVFFTAAQALYEEGFPECGSLHIEEQGEWFAVWTPQDTSVDYDGEIIGMGRSLSEASVDAMATLRQWLSA